jgi:hypothetical protein
MGFPDFFVIGAPKAGTTALHAALTRHPQLFMSQVKEPKFFLCDGPPPSDGGPGDAHSYREWIWRQEDYVRLFDHAPPGSLRGESTPFYLSDPRALERIHSAVPHAKLIAILRDPVDRAYSNWAHLWSDGLETIDDFVVACEEEEVRAQAGWAPIWRYMRTGLYGQQLEQVYSLFPSEQVHLIRYKWLVDEPKETLNAVCRFLGVAEDVVAEAPAENVGTYVEPSTDNRVLRRIFRLGAEVGSLFPPRLWRKASVPLLWLIQRTPQHRPELAQEERATLVGYFEHDVRLLELQTGWDLEDWLSYRQTGAYSLRKSSPPARRLVS